MVFVCVCVFSVLFWEACCLWCSVALGGEVQVECPHVPSAETGPWMVVHLQHFWLGPLKGALVLHLHSFIGRVGQGSGLFNQLSGSEGGPGLMGAVDVKVFMLVSASEPG